MQASSDNRFDIIVENQAGRRLQGFNVRATCDGRTFDVGVTGADGFDVACSAAPSAIAIGVEMYALAYQAIDVSAHAGGDKTYVFAFDPGDLGRKRFAAHRFRISDRMAGLSPMCASSSASACGVVAVDTRRPFGNGAGRYPYGPDEEPPPCPR
jgi:hypothetical protein